jgi:endothelin-converting enzyme/putative endopeptidase
MSIIWTRQLNLATLFRYVNGTWLDNTEIPSDRTLGSFDELRQRQTQDGNLKRQQQIKIQINTDQGKAINLYKTILDTIGRNKLGLHH